MTEYESRLRLVVPAGRLLEPVAQLLRDAGLQMTCNGKDYRPVLSDSRYTVKLLKAANVPKLVEFGAHDIGFSGLDWIQETSADVNILLDTGLRPVRVVAAAPDNAEPLTAQRDGPLTVASEYEQLTRTYMESRNLEYRYVRTYGATEVFPPDDADLIVDNVATGRTLAANNLTIIDEILKSSTQLFAHRASYVDSQKRELIDEFIVAVQSVLDARARVLLDMNVNALRLEAVVRELPAMRAPTVQPLHGEDSFAVRAAVPRESVNGLIRKLRRAGATDILQSEIQRVIL